jgi:hypothetical protein
MIMKLSENTFQVLKNFSNINNSITVKSGSTLRTVSVAENILAVAEVPEEFPQDFSIYDLTEFISGLYIPSMKDPDFSFGNDKYVQIKKDKFSLKYFFADPSLIKQPPEKDIQMEEDIKFTLSSDNLETLQRAASVYQLPDLTVIGDGENIIVSVRDKENDTSNAFSLTVGQTDDEFVLNLKVENVRILKGDYDVIMSKRLISKFINKRIPLTYWIALEPDSN